MTLNSGPTYVTGVDGGLSQADQLNIALELILSQGGIAAMQQIYDAVEARLGQGVFLSDQGRHSLRRIINTVAVDRGYIHPYDMENPGWRITENGAEFIQQELGRRISRIKPTARAYVNFLLAVNEIRALLDFHRAARRSSTQRDPSWEAFKKAGIILIVTSWETFIEDILELHVDQQLEKASSPQEFKNAFDAIAQSWYQAIRTKQDKHPKHPDFVEWTGDNWKRLIRDRLREELIGLNTPKSQSIRDLSARYLDADVTENWVWPGMSAQRAREKLDELIVLRGELAHRTGDYFDVTTSVPLNRLVNAINFVERLVLRTEEAFDSFQQQ